MKQTKSATPKTKKTTTTETTTTAAIETTTAAQTALEIQKAEIAARATAVVRELDEMERTEKAARAANAKRFLFSQPDNAPLYDKQLPMTTYRTYNILVEMSNKQTHMVNAEIAEIAKRLARSPRTVRRHISILDEKGIVVRVFRKNAENPKMSLPNAYYIVGRLAPIYRGTEYGNENPDNDYIHTFCQYPPVMNVRQIQKNNKEIYIESNLKGQMNFAGSLAFSKNPVFASPTPAVTPVKINGCVKTQKPPVRTNDYRDCIAQGHTHANSAVSGKGNEHNAVWEKTAESGNKIAVEKEKTNTAAVIAPEMLDTLDIPAAMRPVVEYLLLKTGRQTITPNECRVIREILDSQHTPLRIMKEIDKQVRRKVRKGQNAKQVSFAYIAAILRNQTSKAQAKERHAANKRAAKERKAVKEKQETMPSVKSPVLPAEISEKIISEYGANANGNKANSSNANGKKSLLDTLTELHAKMQARRAELADKYCTAESTGECPDISFADYLRMLFPNATEQELDVNRAYGCTHSQLMDAFETDMACAFCSGVDSCPLNRKRGRAVVNLKNGRLGVGYTLKTPCRHETETNSDFEQKLKKSGLTDTQAKQTFSAFQHKGMPVEIASAKAKAILAAKNKKSLIIAGNPGTGKTHLATAIAIDAMKAGHSAIFVSVPDLLDELFRADWEHTDFFGLRQKYRDIPCLVLDDLGKEKTTPKRQEYLYQIIDYRYRHGLQTIVTTNAQDMADLVNENNISNIEPLISRLLENGEWVSICETENRRLPVSVATDTAPAAETAGKTAASEPIYRPAPETPDDGLDDSESDLRLYGDTGIRPSDYLR